MAPVVQLNPSTVMLPWLQGSYHTIQRYLGTHMGPSRRHSHLSTLPYEATWLLQASRAGSNVQSHTGMSHDSSQAGLSMRMKHRQRVKAPAAIWQA